MGVTSRAGLPYPEAADPDMPRIDITDLANATDGAFAMFDQGPIAGRPTSTPGSPGEEGRFYYATDQDTLYYDYGTGWQAIQVRSGINSLFPSSPEHGQKWIIAADEAANDPVWEFVWDNAISRWRKIGGEAILKAGNNTARPFTSTNWAQVDTSPDVVIPHPGLYRVRVSLRSLSASVAQFGYISFFINRTVGADDANYDSRADFTWVGTGSQNLIIYETEYDFGTDDESIKVAAKNGSAGNTINVSHPRIELTPMALLG